MLTLEESRIKSFRTKTLKTMNEASLNSLIVYPTKNRLSDVETTSNLTCLLLALEKLFPRFNSIVLEGKVVRF